MQEDKQIKKCTRCGLCASVCPLYEIKPNEKTIARGKFLQLLGVLKGDLVLNKKIRKNIDFCLNCSKCTQNCPSEINTIELFAQIKHKNLTFTERILNSKFLFKLKLLPIKFIFPPSRKLSLKKDEIYFKGCVPSYSNFGENTCCGLPYKASGNIDVANTMIEKNIKIIENPKIKKVYFDCASCYQTVCDYPFKDPETLKKLVLLEPLYFPENKKFSIHKPCHMSQREFLALEEKLKNRANYISAYKDKNFRCCGLGGTFFMKHPFVALELCLRNAQKFIDLKPDYVLSPCPVCTLSLRFGMWYLKFIKRKKHNVKIKQY